MSYLEMLKALKREADAEALALGGKSEGGEEGHPPEISPEREERLRARAQTRARVESRYMFPWPDEVEGAGVRHVGPFTACANCGVGTWAFFGPWPLCAKCADLGRQPRLVHAEGCDCSHCQACRSWPTTGSDT
jgi:hypothetical protein